MTDRKNEKQIFLTRNHFPINKRGKERKERKTKLKNRREYEKQQLEPSSDDTKTEQQIELSLCNAFLSRKADGTDGDVC